MFSYKKNPIDFSGAIEIAESYENNVGNLIFSNNIKNKNNEDYLSSFNIINLKTYNLKFNNNKNNLTINV